jgi:abortive infection bacteriophage resistance protein
MSRFKQPPLNIDEQVELLRKKGLIIEDEDYAKNWLSHVSYFRLKNYTYTFKDDYQGENVGNFLTNTTFEQVINLYLFDKKLKSILFEMLEIVEVAIKTKISNTMSYKFGSHWYLDRKYFRPEFDHDEFMQDLKDKCNESKENYITTYKRVYTDPETPPSWMIMELLTFGTISRIFEQLYARDEKLSICQEFSLPENILISWFHCFSFIRNRCAHHARIVYQRVRTQPIMPSRRKHQFLTETDLVYPDSIYCVLCCLQQIIRKINLSATFEIPIIALMDNSPEINISALGFTPNWKEEAIWRSH